MATAAAIKLTPVILILWMLWAGRRRAAAWAAGLAAGFTLLSAMVAGWGNLVLYVTGFLPSLSRGAATYANQSFNGFLNRLLTDEPEWSRLHTNALARAAGYDWDEIARQIEAACARAMSG